MGDFTRQAIPLILGFAAAAAGGAPPRQPLKIVVRTTAHHFTWEHITYLQHDRKREEFRTIAVSRAFSGTVAGPRQVKITRCDLQREWLLDLDARTYTVSRLPKFLARAQLPAPRPADPRPEPTILIQTTTTDTGERKDLFGRTGGTC